MATLGKSFVDALKEGVQKSGEKDTKAFAKALDGMQRNVSGVANLFRGSELVTSLVVRDQLSSTVFSSATGWQIKGDGTATFRNVTVSGGSLLITNTTDRIHLQSDGDAFFGSNIAAPATTSFSIFSNAQTYNSESMGAGDVLFGDNSANKANLLWDVSDGQIKFRGGTTTQGYIDVDGAAKFGGGTITLNSQGVSIAAGAGETNQIKFGTTSYIYGTESAGDGSLSIAATGVTSPAVSIRGGATNFAGYSQVSIGAGTPISLIRDFNTNASNIQSYVYLQAVASNATPAVGFGGSIDMWGPNAAGAQRRFATIAGLWTDAATPVSALVFSSYTSQTAVEGLRMAPTELAFNETGADIDLRVEGDTATSLLVCDAGLDAVQIGTTVAGAIADFRSTAIVFNEASNDVDFRVESNGNANAITVDGGLDLVGILRAPASGDAALTVLGDMQASGYTGWNFANETWTYASASTFTVPTDLTAKYQKGTKIKLIQGTTKYFYVTASSYSSPNTTVTVTGGSDYVLAQTELLTNPGFETAGTAVELLTNPGFETAGGGAPDYFGTWTEAGGDGAIADEGTLVHGGSHAAKMTGGATPWMCSLYQNLAVVAGTTYQLTIWTRGDGTNAPYVGVLNEAWSAYLVGPYACPVGTTYVQTTLSFTIPVGDDLCSIILFAPPVNGAYAYFDDVSVKSTDLFGTWSETPSDGAIADEGTLVHSGSHAAKFTAGPSVGTGAYQDIVTTAGATYQLSGWARGDGTNAGIYWIYDLSNGAEIKTYTTTGISGTTYAQFSYAFTAPAGCISVRIALYNPAVNGGIAYFDDVSVTLGPITNPYYSYIENPQGFPGWFNWQATPSGYSVTNAVYRFRISGSTCTAFVREGTAGASTNAAHTLTAPVPAIALNNGLWGVAMPILTDNSIALITPGRAYIGSTQTVITLGPTSASDAWTALNNTRHNFTLLYEI